MSTITIQFDSDSAHSIHEDDEVRLSFFNIGLKINLKGKTTTKT